MAGVSDELENELRHALKLRWLPAGFADAITHAVDNASGGKRAKQEQAQRRDAVQRIVKAGAKLQTAIRHANAAYGLSPLPRGHVSSRDRRSWFIWDAWRRVSHPLDHMMDAVLQPWLMMHTPTTRRGNPHEGQRALRLEVFGILDDAGVPITKHAEGAAAKVLRAVLEEADRREGIPPRLRANFNGSWWAYWVAEYRYIAKMASAGIGTNARAVSDWMRTNPPPRRPRPGT